MSNTLNILPFYSSVEQQNHRKDYAFGEVFQLVTPINNILPFQIVRPTSNAPITTAEIYDRKDNLVQSVLPEILDSGLFITSYADYQIINYSGLFAMDIDLDEGFYYLKLSDNLDTWYSELFNMVRNTDQFLKIEYWDVDNLAYNGGELQYLPGFKFDLYLPTQLGRPEYIFEEESTKRDGYTFIQKQVSYKTYRFNFIASEYICDALRVAVLSDNLRIINKGQVYLPDSFLITPTWQDGGFYAAVEAEFTAETILKKVGQKEQSTNPGIDFILVSDGQTDELIVGVYVTDSSEEWVDIQAFPPFEITGQVDQLSYGGITYPVSLGEVQ